MVLGKVVLCSAFSHSIVISPKEYLHIGKLGLDRIFWNSHMLPENKLRKNMDNADAQEAARWTDNYGLERSMAAIFDLINSENVRSRKIAEKIDSGALEAALATTSTEIPPIVLEAIDAKKTESPISVLNELLRISNLKIELFVQDDEQILARQPEREPYRIAELSDGERNAILIGATVLTATPGTILIVDEPERHLHRSIVSPLLSTLFQRRSDCVFIISTHDINLPMDNSESAVLLVRSCVLGRGSHNRCYADLLESGTVITEDVKRAIMGARRTVVFIEGNPESSLDKQLYEIVFPSITLIPKGSTIGVEQATKGVRSTESLNWMSSYGLVDGDDRTAEQLEELAKSGIYAINCYSIESLYYNPDVVFQVAARQAGVTGEETNQLQGAAMACALRSVERHKERLCARVIEKRVKQEIQQSLPDYRFMQSNDVFERSISIAEYLEHEQEQFDKLFLTGDVGGLISRYPVRETEALECIASALGFRSKEKYEMAVRQALIEDEGLREVVQGLLGEAATILQQEA